MFKRSKYWLKKIGPGIVAGASDDDPAAIGTYVQAGAKFGYQFLWLAVLTIIPLQIIQEMAARIGLTSGQGLVSLIRKYESTTSGLFICLLLCFGNLVTIAADLGIMVSAARVIVPWPDALLTMVFAGLMLVGVITLSFPRYMTGLKIISLSLLGYIIVSFMIHPDWSGVWRYALIPSWPSTQDGLIMIVAVLGATISPYIFFWQATEEIEQEIAEGKRSVAQRQGASAISIRAMKADITGGVVISNIIMFCIMLSAAATLHTAGLTGISTADQAAQALQPLAGHYASLVFAISIIGSGFLTIPILAASASFGVAEVFRWRRGLSKKFFQALPFYAVIIAAIGLGVIAHNLGISAIHFLIISSVLNGLLAPFILWHIIRLASRPAVVGNRVSHPFNRIMAWGTFGVVSVAGLALIVQLFIF